MFESSRKIIKREKAGRGGGEGREGEGRFSGE